MLKRLEVHVDAGLLSFAFALGAFLVLAMGLGRLLAGAVGGGIIGALGMIGPAAVIGAALAIWASRAMHRTTTREAMTREAAGQTAWVALATAAVAALLAAAYAAVGTTSAALWIAVALVLLVLAVALAVDAVADLVKAREHRTLDVVRILLLGLLGASLVASLIQPAQLGSEQDISLYVVGITVYMLVVALLSFAYDEAASWRARTRESHTHTPMAPSA